MAYQNVATPRFIIDYFQWWRSLGILKASDMYNNGDILPVDEVAASNNVIGLSPEKQTIVYNLASTNDLGFNFLYYMAYNKGLDDINIEGLIGHNMATTGGTFTFSYIGSDDNRGVLKFNNDIQINCTKSGEYDQNMEAIHDGFSFCSVGGYTGNGILHNDTDIHSASHSSPIKALEPNVRGLTLDNTNIVNGSVKIGSLVLGRYYDMPHSPDLNLTMSREMDGAKRIRTRGGSDLVDHQYTKSPMWGDLAPWELNNPLTDNYNQIHSKIGRRTWDLSFSYLQDSDVFPDTSSLTNYETAGYSDFDDITENTLLESNSFYSQVIHKTNGGQLPFIFQPNKDNSNSDGFAICKFDMNSFQYEQVANGIYNVKLKIREVW